MGPERIDSGLWDESDEFYYDQLVLPDNSHVELKIQSIVGLIPLFANQVLEPEVLQLLPEFSARMQWFLEHRPKLATLVSNWHIAGEGDRRLLSLLRGHRLKALLHRMLDENGFLSEYGVRALSKNHEQKPFRFEAAAQPTRWLLAGRIARRAVRRQLELARSHLDADQLSHHRGAATISLLLWR